MRILWPNGSTSRPTTTSSFGPRKAPVAGASTFHRGTDFVNFDRVRAIADGIVVAVGMPTGWAGGGTQVWIQHDGFLTRSMHMVKGSTVVRLGQRVSAGDDLGQMGRTGNVSGVHLHLEIVVNGVQVDPVPFISNRLSAPAAGGTAPTPVPKEDDDMQSITVNGNLYGVAKQFITHYGDLLQAKTTREVTSATDELHKLSLAQLTALLDGLGIPRNVLDAKGRVLNPQSTAAKPEDRFEGNGTWSREREILAALAALATK